MKRCSNCDSSGPFGRSRSNKDGLKSHCKACCAKKQTAYRNAHPEVWSNWAGANKDHLKARDAVRYTTDPEGAKARVRAWQFLNPDKFKANCDRGNLKKYGITPEQKLFLFEKQGGKCAICSDLLRSGRTGMHIDHDHRTGAIRGLLCHACNVMLGDFAEDVVRFEAAVRYLLRGLVTLPPRSRPPEAANPGSRAMNLWYKYGLTEEAIVELRALQGGGCGVCRELLGPGQGTHIDHDHRQGSKAVRGLLCRSCNIGLGHARESQEILLNAVKYLV